MPRIVGDPPSDTAEILCDAVRACDVAWVRHLLDAGCDPNAVDTRLGADGAPPLIDAASGGHCVLIRVLIDAGANVNARSGSGWTALMRACNAGHLEAARMLLGAGAEPTFVNDEGYSAYGRIPGNHSELLALLLARGGEKR